MQPRKYALRMERRRSSGAGNGEHYTGYGAPALAFRSGDVLAFHRVTASSAGPPFVELWHRDPDGRWTFHATVSPGRCIARHFTDPLTGVRSDDIEVRWTDDSALAVTARHARIRLALRLAGAPVASAASAMAAMVPQSVWSLPLAVRAASTLAGSSMMSGLLPVQGTTTAGDTFLIRPLRFWQVDGVACVLGGRDPGPLEPLTGTGPGGLGLPRTPTFMAARLAFHPAPRW